MVKTHQIDLDTILPAETNSPSATQTIGRRLGEQLRSGAIVALYGDLGAGKTQFVKGICDSLGINSDHVTSPTFSLINEYHGRADATLYHFDAYRLTKLSEFIALGYEEYFFGSGISVIEWAERIEDLLPPDTLRIKLVHVGPETRRIERAAEATQ